MKAPDDFPFCRLSLSGWGGWGKRAYGRQIITQRYVRTCKSRDRGFPLARLFCFYEGKVIEYIHDPLGRRIAKKMDGVIVEKYLWQGLTRLLAVYDGSDNLVMRFEYADGRMPASMTRGGFTYYLTYDQVGSLRLAEGCCRYIGQCGQKD